MLGGTAAALLGIPEASWGRHAVIFSNQSFYEKGNTKWSIWHRKELMISLSVDGCKTWPVRKLIYEGRDRLFLHRTHQGRQCCRAV